METTNKKKNVGFKGIKSAWIVIVCCFIVAVCIYNFVLGNPANFMNNDPNNHPLPGNFLGGYRAFLRYPCRFRPWLFG